MVAIDNLRAFSTDDPNSKFSIQSIQNASGGWWWHHPRRLDEIHHYHQVN
jgi:hypothetical protein